MKNSKNVLDEMFSFSCEFFILKYKRIKIECSKSSLFKEIDDNREYIKIIEK